MSDPRQAGQGVTQRNQHKTGKERERGGEKLLSSQDGRCEIDLDEKAALNRLSRNASGASTPVVNLASDL